MKSKPGKKTTVGCEEIARGGWEGGNLQPGMLVEEIQTATESKVLLLSDTRGWSHHCSSFSPLIGHLPFQGAKKSPGKRLTSLLLPGTRKAPISAGSLMLMACGFPTHVSQVLVTQAVVPHLYPVLTGCKIGHKCSVAWENSCGGYIQRCG